MWHLIVADNNNIYNTEYERETYSYAGRAGDRRGLNDFRLEVCTQYQYY